MFRSTGTAVGKLEIQLLILGCSGGAGAAGARTGQGLGDFMVSNVGTGLIVRFVRDRVL